MMHRSRFSRSGARSEFSSPDSRKPYPQRGANKNGDENVRASSADPGQHAQALVESFGARTALQISQFNAQLSGADRRYWNEVLEKVIEAWAGQNGTPPAP